MYYFFISVTSFLLCFLGTFLAKTFFPKLKLIDKPEKYGLKRKPIPYFGGIVIFLSFWIATSFFVDFDQKLFMVFLSSLILILVCFLDDYCGLKWYIRLPVQFLVAAIVIFSGVKIFSITNPFGGVFDLDNIVYVFRFFGQNIEILLLGDLLILFWIVTMINAMNWMDGVNGLPSGLCFIASLTIFFLSRESFHILDQSVVSVLSLILAFVSLAFLFFDFYPAKILMGDSGSMFLGFMIAVLAIFSGVKIATTAIVFGLPLLDFVWVVFRRIFIDKKSPFNGDLRHIHHRLLTAGFSDRQTLLILYFLCASFGAIAVFTVSPMQKLIAILILSSVMLGLGFYVKWKKC